MKRLTVISLILIVLATAFNCGYADELPYKSFSYTPNGDLFFMQSPYIPESIIGQTLFALDENGNKCAVDGLKGPSDICMDTDGNLYIADRDNNRIVKMSVEGELLQVFGESILCLPEGVFVTENGNVYVADTGNAQIVVFSDEGNLIAQLGVPDDVRLDGIMFTPIKVAVDKRGYLYVQLKGGNDGLMLMDIDGKFQGYFARNTTVLNLSERIKRLFYTDEQIATNQNTVASTVSGMCISEDGFIYTCTSTLSAQQICKYNASGVNLFEGTNMQVSISRGNSKLSAPNALFVNKNGIVYAVDGNNGAVIIYDSNGKPLMTFGEKLAGSNMRIGFFSDPTAIIAADDGTLFVVDRGYNGIQVFQPTTLMRLILESVTLYNDGLYSAAEDGWKQILKLNANYYWANLGLGKIAYMEKNYKVAMEYMKAAENQKYYSDAMWKLRAQIVQKYAAPVISGLLIAYVVFIILKKWIKVGRLTIAKNKIGKDMNSVITNRFPALFHLLCSVRYSTKMIKHPIDTYYETTRRNKGSIASALVVYFIFLAVMLGERALTNFVFDKEGVRGVSLISAFLTYVAPLLLWIASNYLVGAITKGQGTLKGIIISTVYALMPLVLFTLPLALISNVLTLAEGSIYWIARTILYLWVLVLLFLQVKEIHGYEFGESIKNILWILFVAIMMVIAILAIIGILIQAYNFLNEFFRELLGYV